MAVFKAVTALTVLLILLSESTAQLEEFEWKKLVCALFTGVKLSDGRGGLLFTGRILNILTDRSSDRNVLGNMRHDQNYRYFPSLAAAFGVTSQGGFEEVFFNSPGMHAEQKVINQNYQPGYLKSIAINFSPCHKCVQALKDKYLRQDLRPVIQFSWIHNYPRSMDGYDAIRHLKGHGFNLEIWETEILIAFLLEHSPNPTLHDELSAILDSCRKALLERDDATQELIKTIYGVIPDSDSEDEEDDEDEQEEEAYWPGWPGRSYHDSDDDDDDYGAGTGGSGTTGGGGGWSRLGGLNVLGSYYGYRGSSWWGTGATAQHSSGWNHSLFDLAAFVLVGIWVMLLAVSVFLEFLNLLKGSNFPKKEIGLRGTDKKHNMKKLSQVTNTENNLSTMNKGMNQFTQLQEDKKQTTSKKRTRQRNSRPCLVTTVNNDCNKPAAGRTGKRKQKEKSLNSHMLQKNKVKTYIGLLKNL